MTTMHQHSIWAAYLRTRVDQEPTRKERFLDTMEHVIPWTAILEDLGEDTSGSLLGRKPIGVERKLRMYLLAQWFALSDQGVVEMIRDVACTAAFCGFDLTVEKAPDRTTLVRFRKWLGESRFADVLEACVDEACDAAGIRISNGTSVDATVIEASTSTKNKDQEADPEAGRTKKQGNWKHGYKLHIGVDSATRRIHSVSVTPANRHDGKELGALLHGDEEEVHGDSAYHGQGETMARHAPDATDLTHERGAAGHPLTPAQRASNRTKSSTRAKVEHPFRVIKCQFAHRRTRYRGLAKNTEQLRVLCSLANAYLFRHALAQSTV